MKSLDKKQKYELSRLRILSFLTEPEETEHGALVQDILRTASPDHGADAGPRAGAILAEMESSGLIERRPGPRNGKPYYITQPGRDYLAKATEQAMFPEELGAWKAWADEQHRVSLLKMITHEIANIIGGEPEFRQSSRERKQEVSRRIAGHVLDRWVDSQDPGAGKSLDTPIERS